MITVNGDLFKSVEFGALLSLKAENHYSKEDPALTDFDLTKMGEADAKITFENNTLPNTLHLYFVKYANILFSWMFKTFTFPHGVILNFSLKESLGRFANQ